MIEKSADIDPRSTVTLSILRDQRSTYNEPFNGFTFTKFDGSTITV
jgi:hypothetical protein